MKRLPMIATTALLAGALAGCAAAETIDQGTFGRTVWAPLRGNRFRVNSPDTAGGPFKDRWEANQKGLLEIDLPDELSHVAAAGLYLELWGGHPGVADKRFTLNGKGEYVLPEVGAAEKNCTYSYPEAPLKTGELRRGRNEFQFTCQKGSTFWGHYLIRAAGVRLALKADHPAIEKAALRRFAATVTAQQREGKETLDLALSVPEGLAERVVAVEYHGRYLGYDENGDGRADDWHGFTKDRQPAAIIGRSLAPPFTAGWDTSMLPDQDRLAVRAVVRFKELPEITYRTPAVEVALPPRAAQVTIHHAGDLPRPFWSRAGRKMTCTIDLPFDPAGIERAELHVAVWDGGRGDAAQPFTLNGAPLKVDGQGRHDLIYSVVPVDPKILRKGPNEIALVSTTEHHGIEVVLPGPALVVRRKAE